MKGVPEDVLAGVRARKWILPVAEVAHLVQPGGTACYTCDIESCPEITTGVHSYGLENFQPKKREVAGGGAEELVGR